MVRRPSRAAAFLALHVTSVAVTFSTCVMREISRSAEKIGKWAHSKVEEIAFF